MVEKGDVTEARKVISEVPAGFSTPLDKWLRLLADPRAKKEGVASGSRLKPSLASLRSKSVRYRGHWVALKDGQLLGSNASRLALRSDLKRSNELKGAMFFWVEE